MNEYLHNRLIKLIAPKSVIESEFSIPYDCNVPPNILSPKQVDEHWTEIMSFNLGKDKGLLKRIINYFKL